MDFISIIAWALLFMLGIIAFGFLFVIIAVVKKIIDGMDEDYIKGKLKK